MRSIAAPVSETGRAAASDQTEGTALGHADGAGHAAMRGFLRADWIRFRHRRDVLVQALSSPGVLPEGATFDPPEGGFNLWLELPREGPTSTELFLEAVRRGVAFVPGPFFFSAGGGGPASAAALHSLRLSYSALAPANLQRGVALLGEALHSLVGAGRSAESVVY